MFSFDSTLFQNNGYFTQPDFLDIGRNKPTSSLKKPVF